MKKIFKKATTVLACGVLAGFTVAIAAAASYPSPYTSNTAVVYGANAAPSDFDATALIVSNLDANAAGSSGTVTETSGDVVSLDSSSTRIFLNTSINTAKSILTKTDLPVVLGDATFSGNVDAKLTSTITILGGAAAGTGGSNKVIFERQPSSSDEPVIGLSLGSSTQALYNVSFTSKAINFTHADSEGENIQLFGRNFVVSTATDTTDLVLFSSASEVNLVAGGANAHPTTTVIIDDVSYNVELVTGTSTTATIAVNGESKEVTEGASKKINGIDVAVKSVTESTALDTVTATILVGSNKLTFTNGQAVTEGSDDDNIDGTKVHITGGTGAVTKITVEVFRPDSNNDAILAGGSFVDPVFGSFKMDFAGMNIPLDSDDRSMLTLQSSGDKGVQVTMTEDSGVEKTIDFAYNNSNQRFLGNTNNETIGVHEMANMSTVTGSTSDRFIVLGNEEYGHLLELTTLTNSSNTDYTKDKVKLTDVFSGDNYEATFTAEGTGTISIDGKSYTVTMAGGSTTEEELAVTFKYPTGDSADANTGIFYPTIRMENGALVAFYEPIVIGLSTWDGGTNDLTTMKFPDGDGYTSVTNAWTGGADSNDLWTIGGTTVNTTLGADVSFATFTIGQLTYNMTSTGTVNQTKLYVTQSETATGANVASPGLIIFEEKDDASNYEAIIIETETNSAGSGTDGYGYNDIYFTSTTHYDKTMKDSDFSQHVDLFGVLATVDGDDSDQKKVTVSFPDEQIFAQLYMGEADSTVGGSSAGAITVMDTNVADAAGMNLVVVGGSAINSVAASLLGGAYSEGAFTAATGVSAGEFLIESSTYSGNAATLVAGYNAEDTTKAVTYLLNNDVVTDSGTKYIGTSSTEATLQVA
ncbi:hypothetical protein HN876_03685 [archaeon]|jgi:hypothetical protein|nr:hypothetical protein [archaeon]MBT7251988.1 hypothetical protein [archaeon]